MRIWRMRLYFALGAFTVFMGFLWWKNLEKKRNVLLEATVCPAKNRVSLLHFEVKRSGQNLKLVVRPEIPRGLGNPDLFLSLSITSPSGRTVLEKGRRYSKPEGQRV